tara:strand:- start:15126 stop:15398 length:273 start_codon:yes stop_codon:yes gene_type:complete
MVIAVLRDEVVVWLVDDVPVRMVWAGRRWRVIDRPTRLAEEPEFLPPMVTHPPRWPRGWRFTARCATDRQVLVFDVRAVRDGWVIENVWE